MRKLKIDRADLDLATEINGYEITAYLDAVTGKVLFVEEETSRQLDTLLAGEESLEDIQATLQARPDLTDVEIKQLMDVARIEGDTADRYRMIPKQDSREGYQDMQAYIESLDDAHLRELLDVAIQGSGAFRRFKDVLYRYPEAQNAWFAFRDEREWQRILNWLASEDIAPEFK